MAEPAVLALATKLIFPKKAYGRVTVAIGSRHRLSIVGIGPGSPRLRTAAATQAIRSADFVVGYRPYLELISDLLPGKQVFSSSMGKEVDRVATAVDLLEKGSVALVSSGDPNVYGMAGLGLELAEQPSAVEIVPGVTSFTAASCRAGLAFRECVAVISLSDLLTPWQQIEGRLRLAAETQMPVALYNPKSKRRDWQLLRALDICGPRDVLVAKNVGRDGRRDLLHQLRKAAGGGEPAREDQYDLSGHHPWPGHLPGKGSPGGSHKPGGHRPGRSRQSDPGSSEHLTSLAEDLRGTRDTCN